MLAPRKESLSLYVTGTIFAVSVVSSAAFTFELTGSKRHHAVSSSMHPSVRNPPGFYIDVKKRVRMSLGNSLGHYEQASGRDNLFQDFLTYYDVQVFICVLDLFENLNLLFFVPVSHAFHETGRRFSNSG